MGRPLLSTSNGNMAPSDRLALCEIASNILPARRCASIQAQRSSGWVKSMELNGTSGTFFVSLKITLRCKIHVVRRRAPFIGRKGRELARLIVLVGDRDGLFPDAACHLRVKQFLDRLVLEHGLAEEKVDLLDVVLAADLQLLGDRQLTDGRARLICQPDRADIFGVIGHRLEIERTLELHRVAAGVLDRLAERILVRLFRPGDRVAEHIGVERPARMHMGLAEIGVPLRVTLGEGRRVDDADGKSEHRCC